MGYTGSSFYVERELFLTYNGWRYNSCAAFGLALKWIFCKDASTICEWQYLQTRINTLFLTSIIA
jgi:hypothetical protein